MTIHDAALARPRARLAADEHLAANARSLREILGAVGEPTAVDALDAALKASAADGERTEGLRDALSALRDLLADADGRRSSNGRADFDAAVQWHGARLDDLLAGLPAR